eukprot:scaffold318793_cov39-Prasinocladus_malaysianus.AAC.1
MNVSLEATARYFPSGEYLMSATAWERSFALKMGCMLDSFSTMMSPLSPPTARWWASPVSGWLLKAQARALKPTDEVRSMSRARASQMNTREDSHAVAKMSGLVGCQARK